MGIVAIFSMISTADAAGKKAAIQVSATVLPGISQTVVHQAGTFKVTQENVESGYVDVPTATVLKIKTNSPDGYFLTFELNSDEAREVWVMVTVSVSV